MNARSLIWSLTIASFALIATQGAATAPAKKTEKGSGAPSVELLAAGLLGGAGSTVGPDGALYVTETAVGRISRVDPRTGSVTTFATGLPASIIGLGGATDIAFIGRTAYALVTLVGPDVGGGNVVGIYRVDGPHTFTIAADIGAFALQHPPRTPFDVPTGLQFAMERYGSGFLVTDGHHNRVLRVTHRGEVSEFIGFDNIVPTGLAVSGAKVFLAQAGPVPHLPEDGKVVLVHPSRHAVFEVASGAPLLVDVELRRGRRLYALSQGEFEAGGEPGSPALPDTGSLVRANWDGTFDVVAGRLNRPTSLEFIGDAAFVVTLGGEIWKIGLDRRRHDD